MSLILSEIAGLVRGQLHGDGGIVITGAATLACARAGEITLADTSKLEAQLRQCPAAAVIVTSEFQPEHLPYIVVDDVHAAFALIVQCFRPQRPRRAVGVSKQAIVAESANIAAGVDVHPGAIIGEDVTIGPGSTIHSGAVVHDGCRIGANTTVFSSAVLYENTILGDRVLVHSGAVLGAYGFGYASVGGEHRLSAQLGWVEVEDDVDIGACTTIDRGTYGPTRIGAGTKIDNQVQIAHNCRIGRHNLICSQVGIAGSSTTGDYCILAGQVGVRDHIQIGEKAIVGAKAGVMYDVPAGRRYFGAPATEEKHFFQCTSLLYKLPVLRKQIIELQRAVAELSGGEQTASSSRHNAQDAA